MASLHLSLYFLLPIPPLPPLLLPSFLSFFPSLLSLSLIRCHLLLLLLPLLLLLLLFQIDMAKGANFKHIVLKKERE